MTVTSTARRIVSGTPALADTLPVGGACRIRVFTNYAPAPDAATAFAAAKKPLPRGALAELAAIVENSEDAIFGRRVDGIITNWNMGAERIFGYTHLEAVGRPVAMLLPERLKAEEARNTAQVLAGERIVGEHTVRLRKDEIGRASCRERV